MSPARCVLSSVAFLVLIAFAGAAHSGPYPCGNGVAGGTEECDDGNQTDGDGCDSNCTVTRCGNFITTGIEQCDDGNVAAGDGCSPACRLEACGNHTVDPSEECDDGDDTDGNGCDTNCTTTRCGNGVRSGVEECDDGNKVSGDGCSALCKAEICGNSRLDAGEECEDGNAVSFDGCSSDCLAEVCGNARIDPPEQCDDGNVISGDGCDQNCKFTRCGNGILTEGEICDDGNNVAGDGCSALCRLESCGNLVLDPNEQCDDGNNDSGDGCSDVCRSEVCGNEVVDAGEDCDDGNLASGDGCDNNCTFTGCGNGVISGSEECDDGNAVDEDGCSHCLSDFGVQTKGQQGCINEVNRRIAAIVKAEASDGLRCLVAAARGRSAELGPLPGTMDGCLDADVTGAVASQRSALATGAARACFVNDPPELALQDPLSGSSAASSEVIALMRGLLGAPSSVMPSSNAPAAHCQKVAIQGSTALVGRIWKEILHAKKVSLKGRAGAAGAKSDQRLAFEISEALGMSARVEAAADRLAIKVTRSCAAVPNLNVVLPGCAESDVAGLTRCAARKARCAACVVLEAADPKLSIGCDRFDDAELNESCPDAKGG